MVQLSTRIWVLDDVTRCLSSCHRMTHLMTLAAPYLYCTANPESSYCTKNLKRLCTVMDSLYHVLYDLSKNCTRSTVTKVSYSTGVLYSRIPVCIPVFVLYWFLRVLLSSLSSIVPVPVDDNWIIQYGVLNADDKYMNSKLGWQCPWWECRGFE